MKVDLAYPRPLKFLHPVMGHMYLRVFTVSRWFSERHKWFSVILGFLVRRLLSPSVTGLAVFFRSLLSSSAMSSREVVMYNPRVFI